MDKNLVQSEAQALEAEGRRPWLTEPNHKEFWFNGYMCALIRNEMGNWCGYVAVPESHPAYKKDYDDIDVSVHGGLTYADTHLPVKGENNGGEMFDPMWWLGFDCAHLDDFVPSIDDPDSAMNQKILAQTPDSDWLASKREQMLAGSYKTYKDMEYVLAETRHLAEQLASHA